MFNLSQFNSAQFNSFGEAGTGNALFSEGDYFFYNSLEILDETVSPSVPIIKTVRMTTNVAVTMTDEADFFDERVGLIDTWLDFDGIDGDEGNVIIYYRTTQDTTVSPQVWTDWSPFHVTEASCMGAEFKAKLISYNDTVNVVVSKLEIIVEEVT
jgi:hypothetical protein